MDLVFVTHVYDSHTYNVGGQKMWDSRLLGPYVGERQAQFEPLVVSYVYCSRQAPVVLEQVGTAKIVTLVEVNRLSILSQAVVVYLATCHNLVGPDYFTTAATLQRLRLGYPDEINPEMAERLTQQIKHPLELLAY